MTIDEGAHLIAAMAAKGRIEASDVATLRRAFFVEGPTTREQVDALFALEAMRLSKAPEWTEFLVSTSTAHVVWESRPSGVVSESQAEWLLARADEAASVGALAALVDAMAEAQRVPAWFLAAVRARAARGWTGVNEALDAAA
ncbi:MAG: hypothetical protein KGI57_06735 [Hyphomicrobiales bacterium]|nr:hypothetical protein [Hyphomicrobiales bacterium]MDE2017382.1 hypothetical protein [Hyphomicrobiales bacterium]